MDTIESSSGWKQQLSNKRKKKKRQISDGANREFGLQDLSVRQDFGSTPLAIDFNMFLKL